MPKGLLREDLQKLANLRLDEAQLLFACRLFDGAVYLAGLGVECALKACIARQLAAFQFPEAKWVQRINTHNLAALLKEAELDRELDRASDRFKENWTIVKDWRVELRYEIGVSEAGCHDFLDGVVGGDGIMPWLKRFW